MIKVGITGGIGSGKSYICKIAESLYIPVFNTDNVFREILNNDLDIKNYILDSYGEEAYVNGQPNTKFIANIYYNDDAEMAKLTNKVTPKLIIKLNEWFKIHHQKKIVFVESAIMLQSEIGRKHLDKIICILANKRERIHRLLKRDNYRAEKDILNIIDKQMSDTKMTLRSDYSIWNDGEKSIVELTKEIINYLNKIIWENKIEN